MEEIYTSKGQVYTTVIIEEECEEEEEEATETATTATFAPYPVATGKTNSTNATVVPPVKFSSSANAQQGSSASVMVLAGVAALIAVFVM